MTENGTDNSDPMIPVQVPPVDVDTAQSRTAPRVASALFLSLVFCGSALLSLSYFTTADGERAAAQTAAAAAPTDPFASVAITGKSAYVFDLATHRVLYELNPDVQLPLASLTKIMLVLVVSDALSPDEQITVPPHETPDGTVKRIPDGSTWSARDLIAFTLISSSNEGAELLAQAANTAIRTKYPDAPTESATLWRMNALARELGLAHTYFLNVSGLDVSTTQSGAYGSSKDVAMLFANALEHPALFESTAESRMLLYSEEGDRATARNTDKALGNIPGLIMGKTGYTDLAGGNLAVAFDAGPAYPVIVVVLGSTEAGRFDDVTKLAAAARDAIAQGDSSAQ